MQQTNAASTLERPATGLTINAECLRTGSRSVRPSDAQGELRAALARQAIAEAELARVQTERAEAQRERDRLMALVFGQG